MGSNNLRLVFHYIILMRLAFFVYNIIKIMWEAGFIETMFQNHQNIPMD